MVIDAGKVIVFALWHVAKNRSMAVAAKEFVFLYAGGSTCGVLRVMVMGNEIA
jgi:hypothetical protein